MTRMVTLRRSVLLVLALLPAVAAHAQFDKKWLSAGSLHNWFSSVGFEVESQGFVGSQQDGMRWPGIYRYTDMQAAKGLWIGARNVTDDIGTTYDVRVVHVGPRVTGANEFFPVRFELVTRYPLPEVYVDGFLSEGLSPMAVDRVDPDLEADAVLINEVNTLLGLTMRRRILQFSQEFHDNYHIHEYTFTNTGNTDGDPDIERPDQTLEDVFIFLQWRWSVAKETRYIIGNASGWGINTMIDTWGDGENDEMPDGGPVVRAHYAWHGYWPDKAVAYNNMGGPILPEALPDPGGQIASTDTLGRLGASQFIGAVTLHADAAAGNPADDPAQPAVVAWIGSDDNYLSNNDAFNPIKMQQEYRIMSGQGGIQSGGYAAPSHAYVVASGGPADWIRPHAAPNRGTSGGFSAANGYGPYTLAPGESVTIVIAEAAAGLSREANEAIGRAYKLSGANDDALIEYAGQSMTKNEWVFTGRDSLLQTFRRAMANYASGYAVPRPPAPPSTFLVNSGGDRIALEWDYPAEEPTPDRFEIYRASGRFDSTYTRIAEVPGTATSYDDVSEDDGEPIRGIDYYYYVVAVRDNASDGSVGTPAGPLRSSRYFTQTYTPARLKRPAGQSLSEIAIVPNPFNIGSSPDVRWPDQTDKLGFLNIPGRCRIEIYTETGELVDTILHEDGSGDAFWDHTTSARQVIVSGLYIAVITDLETGERAFEKFIIIR
ncbi:hypothetical protein AWN76_013815 [Rhodothermaceae bacterium RA]|nr:hypothetical protein AWN76_013815 [Rhodothermaceae bacterium RA]